MTWGNHHTREHDEYLAGRREREAHIMAINRHLDPRIMREEADAQGINREHYRKMLKEMGEWIDF